MNTLYNIFKTVIAGGAFVLADMEGKIETAWVEGKLTAEEKVELLNAAANKADDSRQLDIPTILADLDARVSALESKGIKVWTSGTVTKKGQTVLYDVDKDGTLDYCRYDGGRASTSSRPGNIEGWVKTDASGNVTHRIVKDEGGNIVLEPVGE